MCNWDGLTNFNDDSYLQYIYTVNDVCTEGGGVGVARPPHQLHRSRTVRQVVTTISNSHHRGADPDPNTTLSGKLGSNRIRFLIRSQLF